LKDVDEHINTKQNKLRRDIKTQSKNLKPDVEEIMQKTRMLKQMDELKRV
jgi:hypothetical protein